MRGDGAPEPGEVSPTPTSDPGPGSKTHGPIEGWTRRCLPTSLGEAGNSDDTMN